MSRKVLSLFEHVLVLQYKELWDQLPAENPPRFYYMSIKTENKLVAYPEIGDVNFKCTLWIFKQQ